MALGPAKLTDLDDPLRGPAASAPTAQPTAPAPRRRASRPAARRTASTAPPERSVTEEKASPGDPYAGSPKIAVNLRATKELWDQLGRLVRELEGEGFRTSRTELTEALWHFHAPQDAAAAREFVRRYRRARIG